MFRRQANNMDKGQRFGLSGFDGGADGTREEIIANRVTEAMKATAPPNGDGGAPVHGLVQSEAGSSENESRQVNRPARVSTPGFRQIKPDV